MKAKEIREKEDAKIREDLVDLRKQLFTLRTQAVTQKLEDPSKLKKIRKDIARAETVLSERRNAAEAKAEAEKAASKKAATATASK